MFLPFESIYLLEYLFVSMLRRTLVALLIPFAGAQNSTACPDPLTAILATLECVSKEDPVCASAGYDADNFKKYHNGVDTNTVIDAGGNFWSGAFALLDISLEYDHMINLATPNQASIRYKEIVKMTTGAEFGVEQPCTISPWGDTYIQHEHALVTVNDDCKMVTWDQYGDNEEQSAVDKAAGLIVSDPLVQCTFGRLPPEDCVNVTAINCRPTSPTPTETNGDDMSSSCRELGTLRLLWLIIVTVAAGSSDLLGIYELYG